MSYREEAKESLIGKDYAQVNYILNKAIKDDSVSSDFYKELAMMCSRNGFRFIYHFNLLVFN